MKNLIYLFLLVFICCSSCSKKIELLGNYKESTIVYGLIDPNDSISYIRIEKAFLTDGHIIDAAQIQDSNQFNYKLDVKLIQGETTITFDTITIFNKEEGEFYAPKMVIYHAVTKGLLNTNDSLYLEIYNPRTKEFISSSTFLHNANLIEYIYPIASIAMEGGYYVRFVSLPNTRTYKVDLRFNYMEQMPNDDYSRVYKHFDWTLNSSNTYHNDGGESIYFYLYPDNFYDLLKARIPATDVLERYYGSIELTVTSGDLILKNYVEINGHGPTILGDRTQYTNIKNGYGIFAARSKTGGAYSIHESTVLRLKQFVTLNFIEIIPGK